MAKKANKKPDNKNLIIGICIAVLVVAVVGIAIFFATKGTGPINDGYFVSDGSKYVATLEGDYMNLSDDASYAPKKTHQVFLYSGDKVTGLTLYLEYADESAAKSALDYFKKQDESASGLTTNGKYIVIEMPEEEYANMTAAQAKQYIELLESMQNGEPEETVDINE